MPKIDIADAEAMIKLLATVADPTVEIPLPRRKHELQRGVAQLVGADAWMWVTSRNSMKLRGDAAMVAIVDGGWTDEAQRTAVLGIVNNPKITPPVTGPLHDAVLLDRSLTISRDQLMNDSTWRESPIGQAFRSSGFDHLLISVYPIGDGMFSAVGFYRRTGTPPFSDRDRSIVHIMLQQVDWLHRAGSNVSASENVIELSPRERQVTMLLMGGDSRKQVAAKLRLSEHTVADYLKEIYRKLGVNSRAELLAKFIPSAR